MKIFDCFMFFDEDQVLDLRLNILNESVDYFVIVESIYNHRGEKRNLLFDKKKYEKFQEKIIYLVYDQIPDKVEEINVNENQKTQDNKYIMNALYRENSQRDFIYQGLKNASNEDLILISDVDEIPKLEEVNLENIKEKIIMFQQDMFYYKFNLKLPGMVWTGTKGCRKKDLLSPQWLRNVKDRKYSKLRLDILFSEKKYNSIKFIDNGGWHFTNIKSAAEIHHKLKSYLHHIEFDQKPLSTSQINDIIKNKQAIYDLTLDQKINKIGGGNKLVNYDFDKLPTYLKQNKKNYAEWLD